MRHVLAPTGEDPVGKVVIEGDRVMVVAETVIDPVVSPISEPGNGKRLKWYKGERHGRIRGPKPSRSKRPKSYKLYVRAVERNLSSQFPHQMTKNYCVWSASKNRDLLYEREEFHF